MSLKDRPRLHADDDVNAVRWQWIDWLRVPGRQKQTDVLENPQNPDARCCLGHACAAFKLPRKVEDLHDVDEGLKQVTYAGCSVTLPTELQMKLDVTDNCGFVRPITYGNGIHSCASGINDETDATPEDIAGILVAQFIAGNCQPFSKSIDRKGT